MLDIRKDIYRKFFFIFVSTFLTLFVFAYFLIKDFLLKSVNPENHDMVMLLDSYNTIWAEIVIVFAIVSVVSFFIVKRLSDTLLSDVEHFTEYLDEINKKNYDAVVYIQHYTEFLRISLIFKNLVKRLKGTSKAKREKSITK